MSDPTLREFITQRIDALERLTDERFDAATKALHLQAAEYQRRLDALNGEADRLRNMQSTYLPRETYEADKRMLAILSWGVAGAVLSSLVAILIAVLR